MKQLTTPIIAMIKTLFVLLPLVLSVQAKASTPDSIRQIDEFITALYEQGDFNGSILVAVNDKPIYSKGFGIANVKSGENFTPSTSSCIASLTKQFTAMGIMMLAERQQLAYDDPVTKYIQKLPKCYEAVTIRH